VASSSVKTHSRTQRVKKGPHRRPGKDVRRALAEARRTNGDRWLADWIGVRPEGVW
jgi:hypothetical protein